MRINKQLATQHVPHKKLQCKQSAEIHIKDNKIELRILT